MNDKIKNISYNEQVIKTIKSVFSRLDNSSAVNLAKLIFSGKDYDIEVREFKSKYESFVHRQRYRFDETENDGNTKFYLKNDIVQDLKKSLFSLLGKIGESIKDIDIEDKERWSKSQINGEEVYEVTQHTTFQHIREKIDEEGKDVIFRYSFKKSDMKPQPYDNITTLQMVDIHVNDNGEYFGFPLKYTYICSECGYLSQKKEYEVCSTGNKIKCENLLENENLNTGKIQTKRCNTSLSPDLSQSETKDSFIHGISFKDGENKIQKAEAITFLHLPKGHLRVVLLKIPRPYDQQLVHIVDYQPIDKEMLPIPEKSSEHYIFTLIKSVDTYIQKISGYKHYGFLPMKIAMILEFFARYNESIKNNFHISLSGEMSSGKSQFARYWSIALYSQDCWSSNATSISIPKLRGTLESFHLFGKDHRYQYRGLLGEKDLLIIDEVKESPDVKNNLKQYLLEPTYEYSKQGSNNQTYERTAHIMVTQNIDTKHLDRYYKAVKEQYVDSKLVYIDDTLIKPAWDEKMDLTLPLFFYNKNPFLKIAIKRVRDLYERNQINWIDGSELALKQRFFFYFFLGSSKVNQDLTDTIRYNNTNDIISNNVELIRLFSSDNLKQIAKESIKLNKGKNDLEYFTKIDTLLTLYGKRSDARTKEMCYTLIKLIRMIDKRDYCTDEDIKILQYILESIDNKTEVADTNEFKINGTDDYDTGFETAFEENISKTIGIDEAFTEFDSDLFGKK